MLENLVQRKNDDECAPVTWIHGCRNEAVHAFKDRVTEITKSNLNIRQHIFYDQVESMDSSIYEGWVELSKIKDYVIDEQAEYYICGPGSFISKHYTFLVDNNIPKSAIHFEEFGPASLQVS